MTTLTQIEVMVARDLRDTTNATFSTAELDDLINQGIDELGWFYPKEVVGSITLAAGTASYSLPSGMSWPYRVDRYDASGNYVGTLTANPGEGPNGGWELHNSILWLPPSRTYASGETLRVFGYGAWLQLSTGTATTDLDTSGLFAVRVFCQVEAFQRLLADRAKFQQWQAASNNTDVSAMGLNQLAFSARRRWQDQRRRLATLRKLG